MPGRHQVGFDHTLRIAAPAVRVIAAFFDARALTHWWDVRTSIATPRVLGAYTLEWPTSDTTDDLLGRFGGVLHGTVIDFQAGRGFLVADCYWLPPDGDPLGPMALEVTCSPADRKAARSDVAAAEVHVVQRGLDDDSPRWVRYYELLGAGWPPALEKMKAYLETGRGVWDLRAYE
jgi:uncharacterized protein YndB with AHSA1/START domain